MATNKTEPQTVAAKTADAVEGLTRDEVKHAAKRLRPCAIGAFLLFSTAMDLSAENTSEAIARAAVHDLVEGRYAEIVAASTPEMAKALPADKLATVWASVLAQVGPLQDLGASTAVDVKDGALVTIPLHFAKATLDCKITVIADKIAGLLLAPPETPPPAWSAPSYSKRAAFSEADITVGSPPWALPRTLLLPIGSGRAPAVVLVHGSGPGDRNETVGANRPFQDLAEGLASRGIAVLRYDKRTKVYGAQVAALQTFTVKEETIDDAVAAVRLLRARADIDPDRVFTLGHSLGGTLAPQIATDDPSLAGLIILAGATLPLSEKIVEQTEYVASLDGPPDAAAQKRIDEVKVEAAKAAAAKPGEIGAPILGAPPSYWADLKAYDAAVAAAQLTLPTLLLQGGRDYQVTARDLDRYKAAVAGHANVTIKEFPSLNHLFIGGEGRSTPEEYRRPGHVDKRVVEEIASFIGRVRH
jgi:uncharacterized protein